MSKIYINNKAEYDALTLTSGNEYLFSKDVVFEDFTTDINASNIKFGSFGSGAPPILSAAKPTAGTWINDSGNLWKLNVTGDTIKWMFINNIPAELAQKETLVATLPTADTMTVSPVVPSGLIGASIIMQKFSFRFELICEVINHVGSVLTVSPNHNTNIGQNCIVYNHKNLMTYEASWWYDSVLEELWIYSTTDPNTMNISYTVNDYVISILQGVNDVVIDGLNIRNSYKYGVYGYENNNVKVINNNFNNIRNFALYILHKCDNWTINSNVMDNIENSGIVLTGLKNSKIQNNTCNNFGLGLNKPFFINSSDINKTAGAFISMSLHNSTSSSDYSFDVPVNLLISGNYSENHSYFGIGTYGDGHVIIDNDIRFINSYFTDGACIHTWGYFTVYPNLSADRIKILNNSVYFAGAIATNGIYTDNGTTNADVRDNTLYNSGIPGNEIKDNSGYNSNVYEDNIIIP